MQPLDQVIQERLDLSSVNFERNVAESMNDDQDGQDEEQDGQDELAGVLQRFDLLVVLGDFIKLLELLLRQDAIYFKLMLLGLERALCSPSAPNPHISCRICQALLLLNELLAHLKHLRHLLCQFCFR